MVTGLQPVHEPHHSDGPISPRGFDGMIGDRAPMQAPFARIAKIALGKTSFAFR
jgi:hypothetical protein